MSSAGPFSLEPLRGVLLHGDLTDEALVRWVEAMRGLSRGLDREFREVLLSLPPEHAAHGLWQGWIARISLRSYEKKVGSTWDEQDRALLLPILWAAADQACWQHRYCLGERLAKRAIARSLEVTLPPSWATLCYLSLSRVYLAQERLEFAQSLLEHLPPCEEPEVQGLVALHWAELGRRQGSLGAANERFDSARELLSAPCDSQDLQGFPELQRGDELFASHHWREASVEYRLAAQALSTQRPGRLGTGLFAPCPLAWPCVSQLAYPWPVAFVVWGRVRVLEAYLHCQGQLARCLRNLGLDDEARGEARQAKAVRLTRGAAALTSVNDRTFPDTAMVKVNLTAPGRKPAWLSWDSARGDLELVTPEHLSSKLLLLGQGGEHGEQFLADLFSKPFPEEAVELRFWGRKAKSSQLEAVIYALWIGFEDGPPLYLPVTG